MTDTTRRRFLGSAALGGFIGGPLGDRLGAKYIIWASILGVLPFTLLLPHVSLFWTAVLTVPIGLILSSAFPAIVGDARFSEDCHLVTPFGITYNQCH